MNQKAKNNNHRQWTLPVILAVITLVTSAVLMLTHELTKDTIERQRLEARLKSLQKLLPESLVDNDVIADAVTIFEPELLGHRGPKQLYMAQKNGHITAVAIPVVARNGYSGDIELMVGVTVAGEITDVAIINHKETPGLGDLIDRNKSDWLQQFPGRSLTNPETKNWKVRKDGGQFDQITAATITPRAVVGAIKKALQYQQSLSLDDFNKEAGTNE
ncbi:electron transport complex subunit RsxG [Marinicella gelatinilytica]|uniref:electron transport complex subunit RsxG n=1 Tax=Marinicella gelatinilytica TaxID=2996017 RepID=UPI002260BDBC|nr:electron transport complex subunit RsxG [Marinicella gelatinilytica]MCX7544061.1 electron transport complex subunit RsxG [Marinicella gelatinilytica]